MSCEYMNNSNAVELLRTRSVARERLVEQHLHHALIIATAVTGTVVALFTAACTDTADTDTLAANLNTEYCPCRYYYTANVLTLLVPLPSSLPWLYRCHCRYRRRHRYRCWDRYHRYRYPYRQHYPCRHHYTVNVLASLFPPSSSLQIP